MQVSTQDALWKHGLGCWRCGGSLGIVEGAGSCFQEPGNMEGVAGQVVTGAGRAEGPLKPSLGLKYDANRWELTWDLVGWKGWRLTPGRC